MEENTKQPDNNNNSGADASYVAPMTDKNFKPLVVGQIYSIPRSKNKFELIKEFDANTECFKRVHDGSLHFGRGFIAFDEGEYFVDIF